MPAIIKLDGKPIGIAESDSQGMGVLEWFHHECRAYSMAHALEHAGYSVETVEDVDCHDVEPLISAICARAGVTMESAFVPFSQSRHAKPGLDGKPWRSLNWRVTIKRHGRDVLETDYAQGEGHAPASKMPDAQAARIKGRSASVAKRAMIDHEIETGHIASGRHSDSGIWGRKPIPAPSIGEVMQSLARDSDVLDAGGFEEWAADLGYDTDSRKAESIYRACVEIALKLQAGLGRRLLAEIRLAASFN